MSRSSHHFHINGLDTKFLRKLKSANTGGYIFRFIYFDQKVIDPLTITCSYSRIPDDDVVTKEGVIPKTTPGLLSCTPHYKVVTEGKPSARPFFRGSLLLLRCLECCRWCSWCWRFLCSWWSWSCKLWCCRFGLRLLNFKVSEPVEFGGPSYFESPSVEPRTVLKKWWDWIFPPSPWWRMHAGWRVRNLLLLSWSGFASARAGDLSDVAMIWASARLKFRLHCRRI